MPMFLTNIQGGNSWDFIFVYEIRTQNLEKIIEVAE